VMRIFETSETFEFRLERREARKQALKSEALRRNGFDSARGQRMDLAREDLPPVLLASST